MGCFHYFKDTNLKANHNVFEKQDLCPLMFPLFQRYEFESDKGGSRAPLKKYTNASKANHNQFRWFVVLRL